MAYSASFMRSMRGGALVHGSKEDRILHILVKKIVLKWSWTLAS